MIYDHTTNDPEYDDTLTPGERKNRKELIIATIILIAIAVRIIMNMGLFNPN